MKDFYKILGVKETDSEQTIRAKWIELTKRHHPDSSRGSGSNEKMREINEAYQILKHPSTRMEYDLKRRFDPKKRASGLVKRSLFTCFLVLGIMLSVLYAKSDQGIYLSESIFFNQPDQKGTKNQVDQKDQMILIFPAMAQFKLPPLLATEEEVKTFFAGYIERYHRMDVEGFLSLFSLKAIQNQRDGIQGIRNIYTEFFNQSQEVRYRLQELKIEIYQNAVEAKARYEIDQVLRRGGEKISWRGSIRWVLVKENGALKIISLDYQHQSAS